MSMETRNIIVGLWAWVPQVGLTQPVTQVMCLSESVSQVPIDIGTRDTLRG